MLVPLRSNGTNMASPFKALYSIYILGRNMFMNNARNHTDLNLGEVAREAKMVRPHRNFQIGDIVLLTD